MNLKRILFKTSLGLVVVLLGIILAAVAATFWMADPLNLRAPTDKKLIKIFSAHREAFEQIQQMASEDARYGWYFNSPYFQGAELDEAYHQEYEKEPRYSWYFKSPFFQGGKLKEARRQEYERLVSEIGSNVHVGTGDDKSMAFGFAGGGILAIGPEWEKGIAYVPGSYETNGAIYCQRIVDGIAYPEWHGMLLSNLDNARALPALFYMRRIGPDWFIYYSRDED
jgi:hypothetical protein